MSKVYRVIILGVGSLLDFNGRFRTRSFHTDSPTDGFARDGAALASDWVSVGHDVRNAMTKAKKEDPRLKHVAEECAAR